MVCCVFNPFYCKRCVSDFRLSGMRPSLSESSTRMADGMLPLIGGFVVAGGAAGFAVHQAVRADAHVEYGLAKAAVFIALALTFWHFALCATGFGLAGSGGHSGNVTQEWRDGKRAVGNPDVLGRDTAFSSAPVGACSRVQLDYPRLRPWAAFSRRSAACRTPRAI